MRRRYILDVVNGRIHIAAFTNGIVLLADDGKYLWEADFSVGEGEVASAVLLQQFLEVAAAEVPAEEMYEAASAVTVEARYP